MIKSTVRMGVRVVTAAAVAAGGIAGVAIAAGAASATVPDTSTCRASTVLNERDINDGHTYYVHVCVTDSREKCTGWVVDTASAVEGNAGDMNANCTYTGQDSGGWHHPAGYYGSVVSQQR